jgi:hypothetical protein
MGLGSSDMDRPDIELTRTYARIYRARGFNPVPAEMGLKKPLITIADRWEREVPEALFNKFQTTNCMLMTGRKPWRLLVIDLDGEEAVLRWERMGWTPKTWVSHSGGGGRHVWFLISEDYPERLPLACLWKGEGKHERIDRLCDLSLVTVPPSFHVKTGRRYRFLDKAHSPMGLGIPADVPQWVLGLEPIRPERPVVLPSPVARRYRNEVCRSSRFVDRRRVLEAIPDKIRVARSWGVQFTGYRSPKGWWECRAVDREDNHPSAAVHEVEGNYVDRGSGLALSFFDLAVLMGVYHDWREAKDSLAIERNLA